MIICTDASVIVKWFRKGEAKEKFALKLKDDILDEKISATYSEWVLLEVIRALTKAGYPQEKIEDARSFLLGLEAGGFIEVINIKDVRELASNIIYKLNLYASDAVILATAIRSKTDLITEDQHLLKRTVIEYAKENKVKIYTLDKITEI